jgi:hypothetical protein
MVVTGVNDKWARAETPNGNAFWVGSFTSAPAERSVKTGELAPVRGWISTDYGQRTPAPLLAYSCRARLPWRSVTLLIPSRRMSPTPPSVSPLFDDQHLPTGLELEDFRESILIDETDLYRSPVQ